VTRSGLLSYLIFALKSESSPRTKAYLPETNVLFEVEDSHDDVAYSKIDITTDDVEDLGYYDAESIELSDNPGCGEEITVTVQDNEKGRRRSRRWFNKI
jgi:hypothetical protein